MSDGEREWWGLIHLSAFHAWEGKKCVETKGISRAGALGWRPGKQGGDGQGSGWVASNSTKVNKETANES
jgi:hypothetical protein